MVRERIRRAEPCAEDGCGSKRFYIDDDGYTYCERGHRQVEHGTLVTTDTGELVLTGKSHRRVDSDGESIATSRSGFTKPQAQEHYLLCLQLVLRKQTSWLIAEKRLPPQFEALLKDLWALRIQQLLRLPGSETQTDDERSHAYSSQTEAETTDTNNKQKSKTSAKVPSVLDNIALLHIGMILLRLPISTADLCSWIRDGHLLYYYSAKAAPIELLKRLPASLQRLLTPQSVLKGENLQEVVTKTLDSLSSIYGMQISPINHNLLLYRWLKLMSLPIEVFAATRRLANSVEDDFSFITTPYRAARTPELRLMAMIVVTTKLFFPMDDLERLPASPNDLSILQQDWYAWRRSFLTSSSEDKLAYQDAFTLDEARCMQMGAVQLDQYLDWYQENIAVDYINERGRAARDADFRRALLSMFPITTSIGPIARGGDMSSIPSQSTVSDVTEVAAPNKPDRVITTRLRQAQQRMSPGLLVHEQKSLKSPRLGSFYHRYRTMKDLLSAPPAMLKLYDLAAQHSGVDIELVVRAVIALERQLERTGIDQ